MSITSKMYVHMIRQESKVALAFVLMPLNAPKLMGANKTFENLPYTSVIIRYRIRTSTGSKKTVVVLCIRSEVYIFPLAWTII